MPPYGVILFHTTSAALRSEKVLKGRGLAVKLIPTPREFSSDCGMALRFEWAEVERINTLLAEARVETGSVHPLEP
ncbi:MAG: DUF3343 domain-containing protein [Chloroflexi bacterium]|nr:DUF3343 domain-containing protein [Chloroflexota bacterium]